MSRLLPRHAWNCLVHPRFLNELILSNRGSLNAWWLAWTVVFSFLQFNTMARRSGAPWSIPIFNKWKLQWLALFEATIHFMNRICFLLSQALWMCADALPRTQRRYPVSAWCSSNSNFNLSRATPCKWITSNFEFFGFPKRLALLANIFPDQKPLSCLLFSQKNCQHLSQKPSHTKQWNWAGPQPSQWIFGLNKSFSNFCWGCLTHTHPPPSLYILYNPDSCYAKPSGTAATPKRGTAPHYGISPRDPCNLCNGKDFCHQTHRCGLDILRMSSNAMSFKTRADDDSGETNAKYFGRTANQIRLYRQRDHWTKLMFFGANCHTNIRRQADSNKKDNLQLKTFKRTIQAKNVFLIQLYPPGPPVVGARFSRQQVKLRRSILLVFGKKGDEVFLGRTILKIVSLRRGRKTKKMLRTLHPMFLPSPENIEQSLDAFSRWFFWRNVIGKAVGTHMMKCWCTKPLMSTKYWR